MYDMTMCSVLLSVRNLKFFVQGVHASLIFGFQILRPYKDLLLGVFDQKGLI